MVTHLVLCTPRTGLTPDEEQSIARALEQAIHSIPSVRHFSVGRRVRHGAAYEESAGSAEFAVLFEFDDLDGLRAYLRHPAHEELGRHFRESMEAAHAYDFDTAGVEMLPQLLKKRSEA